MSVASVTEVPYTPASILVLVLSTTSESILARVPSRPAGIIYRLYDWVTASVAYCWEGSTTFLISKGGFISSITTKCCSIS